MIYDKSFTLNNICFFCGVKLKGEKLVIYHLALHILNLLLRANYIVLTTVIWARSPCENKGTYKSISFVIKTCSI